MATNDPLGVPEIEDKRMKPAGLLPKHAQAWALTILALVMVLVIWFSKGAGPKQRPKEPTMPLTSDPNSTRIDEVRQRIDALANKNRTEQKRIAALQSAITSQDGLAPAELRNPITAPASVYGGRGFLDANPQGGWLDPEEQKRISRAPYSSNVALSYRKEDQASTEQVAAADLKAFAANLTDGSTRLPSSGSGTPQHTAPKPDAKQDEEERKRSDRQRNTQPAHPHRPGEIDYPLSEGTVLETVLTNRLDGYFSGPVNCMVTTDVYSPNGAHVLIPSGSRVLGEVRRVDTFGQQRLAVVFHRLIMPDGYSVLLDQFKGLNQIGETGLRDQVNNHYVQLFGVSLAIGAIAGLAQSNASYGVDVTGTQAYEQGVANSLSQTSLHILDRYLNVLPTFTIREGHRVKIYLTQDILVPAYDKHVAEAESGAQQIADIAPTNTRAQEE